MPQLPGQAVTLPPPPGQTLTGEKTIWFVNCILELNRSCVYLIFIFILALLRDCRKRPPGDSCGQLLAAAAAAMLLISPPAQTGEPTDHFSCEAQSSCEKSNSIYINILHFFKISPSKMFLFVLSLFCQESSLARPPCRNVELRLCLGVARLLPLQSRAELINTIIHCWPTRKLD